MNWWIVERSEGGTEWRRERTSGSEYCFRSVAGRMLLSIVWIVVVSVFVWSWLHFLSASWIESIGIQSYIRLSIQSDIQQRIPIPFNTYSHVILWMNRWMRVHPFAVRMNIFDGNWMMFAILCEKFNRERIEDWSQWFLDTITLIWSRKRFDRKIRLPR